jgi:hypothetical protein
LIDYHKNNHLIEIQSDDCFCYFRSLSELAIPIYAGVYIKGCPAFQTLSLQAAPLPESPRIIIFLALSMIAS